MDTTANTARALPNATGDCFDAAFEGMLESMLVGVPARKLRLVHGTCMGQGPIKGIRYCHAWLEFDSTVVDVSNGNEPIVPRSWYYDRGQVQDQVVYTVQEARALARSTGHVGPWDNRFEGLP